MFFDFGDDIQLDDANRSLKMIRSIRNVLGHAGTLIADLSHGNQPAAFLPSVERICDGVVKGEGFHPASLDDPYLVHEIATTRWTGTPVGWPYHRTWPGMCDWTTLDDFMRWQVERGMMGVTYSRRKVVDRRYVWSDGRTSYYRAWERMARSRCRLD